MSSIYACLTTCFGKKKITCMNRFLDCTVFGTICLIRCLQNLLICVPISAYVCLHIISIEVRMASIGFLLCLDYIILKPTDTPRPSELYVIKMAFRWVVVPGLALVMTSAMADPVRVGQKPQPPAIYGSYGYRSTNYASNYFLIAFINPYASTWQCHSNVFPV